MTDVAAAVAALERGGVVAFPTETVWGLGARLDRPDAVRRIFELKGRPREKVLQVLMADARAFGGVARVTSDAARLAEAFMPGPLTVVLESTTDLPAEVAGGGTIGLRVPDHPVALALLRDAGPLAATSANRSGDAAPMQLEAVRTLFGDAVTVYLGGAPPRSHVASTVLDLSGPEPVVLRRGALPVADLERVLGRSVAG